MEKTINLNQRTLKMCILLIARVLVDRDGSGTALDISTQLDQAIDTATILKICHKIPTMFVVVDAVTPSTISLTQKAWQLGDDADQLLKSTPSLDIADII